MKNLEDSLKTNYPGNTGIVKYLCLVLAFAILNSCSTYRINRLKNKSFKKWKSFQWTETKRSSDKDTVEWTIYSKKIKGTNLLGYKIEGEIATSPEACVTAFRKDIHQQAAKEGSKKYPIYTIVNEHRDSLLIYLIHNEPFPFKDTEMSVKYLFSMNEDGDAKIAWHEAWDTSSVKPTKKFNRVETFRGSWQFIKDSKKKSIAINIVQFDAKGMPKFLVQPMVTNFLRKGLENLRETTAKLKL